MKGACTEPVLTGSFFGRRSLLLYSLLTSLLHKGEEVVQEVLAFGILVNFVQLNNNLQLIFCNLKKI